MTYLVQAIRFFVLISILVIAYCYAIKQVPLVVCVDEWFLLTLGLVPFVMSAYACLKLYEVTHGE